MCRNCFNHYFNSIEEHQRLCFENKPSNIVIPGKNTTLKFKNYKKITKDDFLIYSDMEAAFSKLTDERPEPYKSSFTKNKNRHTLIGWAFLIVCKKSSIMHPKYFSHIIKENETEEDLINSYNESLENETKNIYDEFLKNHKK